MNDRTKIVAWEFTSNNSGSTYIAKLECGHERRDLGHIYPRPHAALCWKCPRKEQ